MHVPARALLALAAVVALNLSMHIALGFFVWRAFVGVVVALALALAALACPERRLARVRLLPLLACVAFALGGLNAARMYVTFVDNPAGRVVAQIAAALATLATLAACGFAGKTTRRVSRKAWVATAITLAFGLVIILTGTQLGELDEWPPIAAVALSLLAVAATLFARQPTLLRAEAPEAGRGAVWLFGVMLVLGAVMRLAIVCATPNPIIDVFTLLRDGTNHVVCGRNPYSERYDSPYASPAAGGYFMAEPVEDRPAGYPPHPFLIAAPFIAARLDVRCANVACDLVAAAAIFGVAWRRGRPMTGLMAASMWLNMPLTSVMIESAWYEPMIAALVGAGFFLIEGRGAARWAGYVSLGLALTAKQYGVFVLPALAWPHRDQWRRLLVGLALGLAVMLPWLLWSPPDFMNIVLWKHLARPPQHERATTFAAAAYRATGMLPPREVMWAAAAVLIAFVSWRTPRGAATALGMGTALFVFCLCHTQGFFNYFHLVQYLWLLGVVGMLKANSALPPRSTREA